MAYTALNTVLLGQGLTSSVPRLWVTTSTDSTSTVDTAAFISDASSLGMKANDIVLHVNTTTHSVQAFGVFTVTASSGADLGDGVQIATTSNTD